MRLGCASRLQRNCLAHACGTPGATYTRLQLLPPCRNKLFFSCHTSALGMCSQTPVAQHETCPWRHQRRHSQPEKGCSVRLGCTASCKTPHSTEPCWRIPCSCRAGDTQAQASHWWSMRHECPTQPLIAPKPRQQQAEKGSEQQVPNAERTSSSQEVEQSSGTTSWMLLAGDQDLLS